MSSTSKQSVIQPTGPNVDAVSNGHLKTDVDIAPGIETSPEIAGIAIQRLAWSPVYPGSRITPELSLGITLELNLYSRPGQRTVELFRSLWQENVTPALIANGEVICCFEPDEEILREIITTANRPGVQPGVHTRRIESPGGCAGNTLIFSDSLNLCDRGLIIAAVYDDSRDLKFGASETLKALVLQLQQDHRALLSILGKTLRRPRAYRALIDINAGECLWCGPNENENQNTEEQSAPDTVVDWSSLAKRFRPDSRKVEASAKDSARPLALVTSLAKEHVEYAPSGRSKLFDYRIPDSVGRRLGKIITIPDTKTEPRERESVALPSSRKRHLALSAESSRLVSADRNGPSRQDIEKTDKAESEKRSKQNTPSHKKKDPRTPAQEAQSKTALRIALQRLPKGGKLKLTAINHDGEMQFDSFDVTGEQLVSVSVKDPDKGNK